MRARAQVVRGVTVPSFFYGTAWKEERTEALTRAALEAGFRAIDTANQRRHYHEAAVGDAVAAAIDRGLVARAELFLQTKFTSVDGQDERLPYDARAPVGEQVAQSFASSLEHLHTDYLDSYVLHGPSRSIGLGDDDWQAWRAIGDLQRDGRTRLVGVSNVSGDQLAELWRGTEVKPAFVQNRCYARDGWDAQVRAFCRDHDIAYQGFSLLTANRRELASTTVRALAARLRCTVPQLVFAFARTIGIIPLTGSSDRGHLAEDLDSLELVLDDGDVEAVASLAATALSR